MSSFFFRAPEPPPDQIDLHYFIILQGPYGEMAGFQPSGIFPKPAFYLIAGRVQRVE